MQIKIGNTLYIIDFATIKFNIFRWWYNHCVLSFNTKKYGVGINLMNLGGIYVRYRHKPIPYEYFSGTYEVTEVNLRWYPKFQRVSYPSA